MKKFFIFMAIATMAFIAISCTSMLPARFERFVDKVEKNASSYTEEDWDKVSKQFDKLAEQYKKSYDRLSKEDRSRIDKAIGRYRAIVFKSGLNNAVKSFEKTISDLSSTVKGIVEGIGSFFKELGDGGTE